MLNPLNNLQTKKLLFLPTNTKTSIKPSQNQTTIHRWMSKPLNCGTTRSTTNNDWWPTTTQTLNSLNRTLFTILTSLLPPLPLPLILNLHLSLLSSTLDLSLICSLSYSPLTHFSISISSIYSTSYSISLPPTTMKTSICLNGTLFHLISSNSFFFLAILFFTICPSYALFTIRLYP